MKKILLIIFSGLFISGSVYSQSGAVKTDETLGSGFDKRLLNHYTEQELLDIKASDPQKFTSIEYYYTQSYQLIPVSCVDCVPADLTTFDVSKYEDLRKKSERFDHTFEKYGFRLVLLSRDELLFKTPYQIAKDE
ncbi:MAG: hypothetical protein ACOZCO_06120 [Bacteroidota bacterium]